MIQTKPPLAELPGPAPTLARTTLQVLVPVCPLNLPGTLLYVPGTQPLERLKSLFSRALEPV